MFVFSGCRLAPVGWLVVGFVILVHEVGHAGMARMAGGAVKTLDLIGVGGVCQWTGDVTPLWRAGVAWGGVLAQLTLFAAAYAILLLIRPENATVVYVFYVLITSNLFMALFNLIPVEHLDGAEAWKVVPEGVRALLRRIRGRGRESARRRGARTLRRVDALRDDEIDPQLDEQLKRIVERVRDDD